MTKTGSDTCRLTGYPDVHLLNAHGNVAGTAVRTPTGSAVGLGPDTPIPIIELQRGEVASAVMEGTDIPTGDTSTCPSYASFEVTLPEQTQPVTIHQGTRQLFGALRPPVRHRLQRDVPERRRRWQCSGLQEVRQHCPACHQWSKWRPCLAHRSLAWSWSRPVPKVRNPSRSFSTPAGTRSRSSPHDPSVENVVVRAGQSTQLGTYGGCYQVTSVPTPTTGLGNLPTTSTTSP